MKKIMCVFANVPGGRTIYVKELARRSDGKFTVITTFEKDEAKDFDTAQNALSRIDNFYNPYERVYAAKSIEVKRTFSFLAAEAEML